MSATPVTASSVSRFLHEHGFFGFTVRRMGDNTASMPQDSVLISCDWQDRPHLSRAVNVLTTVGNYHTVTASRRDEWWVAVLGKESAR